MRRKHVYGSAKTDRVYPIKVGERGYRAAYLSPEGHVVKVGKSFHLKRYGRVWVPIPTVFQSMLKLGHMSPNRAEFENYRKFFSHIPARFRASFARVLTLERKNGRSELTMERVTDYTGKTSRSMEETGPVRNIFFWKRFDELYDWFNAANIPFFEFHPNNFLVKWISKSKAIPVLIDYKHMGKRRYPFQPWLWIKGQVKKKMIRRYARLKENYWRESD